MTKTAFDFKCYELIETTSSPANNKCMSVPSLHAGEHIDFWSFRIDCSFLVEERTLLGVDFDARLCYLAKEIAQSLEPTPIMPR